MIVPCLESGPGSPREENALVRRLPCVWAAARRGLAAGYARFIFLSSNRTLELDANRPESVGGAGPRYVRETVSSSWLGWRVRGGGGLLQPWADRLRSKVSSVWSRDRRRFWT